MNPQAGLTLGSLVLRYKVADGGMGSIWAAEHVTLNREVAVKFLTRNKDQDEEAVQRFALEARTVARISSPHIPQVFDHGICADGTPYIVMELVAGTDLKSWVTQRGRMSMAQAARLIEQMCVAMTAAHELGIVHRDIKPENIILDGGDSDFHAKLVDFGIAKSNALSLSNPSLTRAGTTMGTPNYMSPEQLMSAHDVDERSDVWSLGVVAYWALTMTLPFDGETFGAVCVSINRAHFTPVTELRPDLPESLNGWFDKALSRDANERFQSAAVMSRMLKVATAKPADWTQAMPVVNAASLRPAALEITAETPMGGLSRTTPLPTPTLLQRRKRQLRLGGAGAALGFVAFAAYLFLPGLSPTPNANLSPVAAEVTGTKSLSMGTSTPVREPAAPVEVTAPAPVPSTPPVTAAVAVEQLPVAPPVVVTRAAKWTAASVVGTKPRPTKAATSAAPVPPTTPAASSNPAAVVATGSTPPKSAAVDPALASAAPPPPVAPPPDPAAWHPSDDLGEP